MPGVVRKIMALDERIRGKTAILRGLEREAERMTAEHSSLAKSLGESRQRIDEAGQQLGKAWDSLSSVNQAKAKAEAELISLNQAVASKQGEVARLNAEYSERLDAMRIAESALIARAESLSSAADRAEIDLAEKQALASGLILARSELERAEQGRISAESARKQAESDLSLIRAGIEAEKAGYAAEKARIEAQSTKNERDRGDLEAFARLLQRYYDQSGINMSILPSFGIPELSE